MKWLTGGEETAPSNTILIETFQKLLSQQQICVWERLMNSVTSNPAAEIIPSVFSSSLLREQTEWMSDDGNFSLMIPNLTGFSFWFPTFNTEAWRFLEVRLPTVIPWNSPPPPPPPPPSRWHVGQTAAAVEKESCRRAESVCTADHWKTLNLQLAYFNSADTSH